MSTNAPGVLDLTLQKLVDAIISCIKRGDGVYPDAPPHSFKDRLQENVPVLGSAFKIIIEISPNGVAASAQVIPPACGAESIAGAIDNNLLATKLA